MLNRKCLAILITLGMWSGAAVAQGEPDREEAAQESAAEEVWLPTLITDTPEEGFELAIRLARRGVLMTQPDVEVLRTLRPAYAHDPDSLTAASQVVAIHFQTIAAANGYWREEN